MRFSQILKYLFLLFFQITLSQTLILEGTVSDTLNKPLEFANVLGKPKDTSKSLVFATADASGKYRLELSDGVSYEISVSYIGYVAQSFAFEAGSGVKRHDFRLASTGELLKEVVIKHEPIVIKKDTLVFDVRSFASGNERKMKEVLEKLPGVEVDRNGNVTVQGKRVTQMLVEDKSFFGGGSKLAVENIPADAIDKIEVIDHFNEVGFMKQVSDSKDLAMNVKLREEKKKFVFGDIEAGAGDRNFYLAHAAIFYYSPKTNFSFIGDANNVGKSTFSYDDLQRFEGGSMFMNRRATGISLFQYTMENKDLAETRSQFAAANFSVDASEKLSVTGFGIFSKLFTGEREEAFNQYLQNDLTILETRTSLTDNRALLGMGNFKIDYKRSKNERMFYKVQFQSSGNDLVNTLRSVTDGEATDFQTLTNADNTAFHQYLEWHKKQNDRHTFTFVTEHSYNSQRPENLWFTNREFLPGLIPLQPDADYHIDQLKYVKNNNIDLLFRHYWVINKGNHLYTTIGNNTGNSGFRTSERQILSDGSLNDFASSGFGNDLDYRLNDAYATVEYKFRIGKWINKPGVSFHWYDLRTKQRSGDRTLSKGLFEPRWFSEYEFTDGTKLNFDYALTNTFARPMQMADAFTLQSYNAVFRGNPFLENERFHAARLNYSKFGMGGKLQLHGSASFNKKVRTVRNDVVLQGIDQFNMPVLYDNPETTWNTSASVTKKIYRFRFGINASANWFTYIQTLNGLSMENQRNSQGLGADVTTVYKKWPYLTLRYTKRWNQFRGLSDAEFQSDHFNARLRWTVFEDWSMDAAHEYLSNRDNNGQRNAFGLTSAGIDYQKKNSAWRFSASVNNLFNNNRKYSYSFSDYQISEQSVAVLPRIWLLTISYKL